LPSDRTDPEGNETFRLYLSTDRNGIGPEVAGHLITIIDDDMPESAPPGSVLQPGLTVDGALTEMPFLDWYALDLIAGQAVALSVSALDAMQDPNLTLIIADAAGRIPDLGSGGGRTLFQPRGGPYAAMTITPAVSQEVYIAVGATLFGSSPVPYRLSVHSDISDQPIGAASLSTGDTVYSRIDVPQDQDLFRIVLDEMEDHVFTLSAHGADGLSDGRLTLYSMTPEGEVGAQIQTAAIADGKAIFGTATSTTGPHFLRVEGVPGDYALSFRADPGRARETTAILRPGEDRQGAIEFAFDRDSYRVEIEVGQSYAFLLQPDASGGAAVPSPRLHLIDAEGRPLGTSTSLLRDPLLVYTPTRNEVVYIEVDAERTELIPPTGDYLLRLEADIPDGPTSREQIKLGQSIAGRTGHAEDTDWFAMESALARPIGLCLMQRPICGRALIRPCACFRSLAKSLRRQVPALALSRLSGGRSRMGWDGLKSIQYPLVFSQHI
jgi:hypothetical protein